MSKVVDYTIVTAVSRLELADTVKRWMKDDWYPQGGHVVFTYADYPPEYQQTLVQYENTIMVKYETPGS